MAQVLYVCFFDAGCSLSLSLLDEEEDALAAGAGGGALPAPPPCFAVSSIAMTARWS